MNFYQSEVMRLFRLRHPNDGQTETVVATRRFIRKNFARNINLDLIASEHHISKFHLLRLFKRYYGETPQEYISQLRLTKAKKALSEGSSAKDVCFEIGFESPSTFSNWFKGKTGKSPRAFKKSKIQ